MNCQYVNSKISAYVDGELRGDEMIAVRTHLLRCPACTQMLEDSRMLKRVMAGLQPVKPAASLELRLLAALDFAETPASARAQMWLRSHVFERFQSASTLVAACAGMFLLALGHLPQTAQWTANVVPVLQQETTIPRADLPLTDSSFVTVPDRTIAANWNPQPSIWERLDRGSTGTLSPVSHIEYASFGDR